MMRWGHNGMGTWGWLGMGLGMLVFVAVVIGVVMLLIRRFASPGGRLTATQATSAPEELLSERFARGEIDENEYHGRLAVLRQAAHR